MPFAPIGVPILCAAAAALLGLRAPMTWTLVLVLAAAAYSFKVVGLIVIGRRQLPARSNGVSR